MVSGFKKDFFFLAVFLYTGICVGFSISKLSKELTFLLFTYLQHAHKNKNGK